MAKTYYTYRIRVANRDRVQVEKWDAQHQDKGQPSGAFRYQENLAEIALLLQAASNNVLNDSSLARALGEALFDVLFDDVLRQDFVNFYYQVVQQEKQLLRVELDIDEQGMPEIAALPWEFMCVPARANLGTIWMGTVPDLVFSRRRSQWIAAQPIQLESDEKLRIALIISAPSNLPPVAYEPVQAALEKLAVEQAKRVELLPIISSANPETIDTILSKDPHIFHFIGHGRMKNEGKQEVGEIALVDPDFNEAMWVDADYFSELFNQHRPGVVMLQACEGGMLSSSQAFVGVASKVVQQNVPVVVAMQYEVTNSTASRFALRFYQQLAAEDPVDIAVQYARRAIALGPTQYHKRDFATPVIFMRVRDGHLFKRQEPEAESSNSNDQSASKDNTGNLIRKGSKYTIADIIQAIFAIFLEILPNKKQQDEYNRKNLLNKVYSDWVKDGLEGSLYHKIELDLGLEEWKDAVELPTATLAKPRRNLPQGTGIVEEFDSLIAGQRLLILGAAGSGKTIALLALAQELIKRAKKNSKLPIPVVFHLSSWKDSKQSLEKWLIAELYDKYKFNDEKIRRAWIKKQQLLLLLDGLDEVRADLQADCIKTINQFIQNHEKTQIVICSRSNKYEQLGVRLNCQTALFIQPLKSEEIDRYFQSLSGTELQGIRSALKTDPVLAELAKTPLFLWIMSLAYEDVSAEKLPQEQSADAQIKRIFNQYLNRMAEPPQKGQRYPYDQEIIRTKKPGKQSKPSYTYSKQETLEWLQFLARRTTQESSSIFLIEHIHPGWLPTTISPWCYRLGVGLVAGLVMEWIYGLPLGLMGGMLSFQMLTGLLAGLILGTLGSMNSEIKLFDSLGWSWSWKRAFKTAMPGLLSGPIISIIFCFMDMIKVISVGDFWNAITMGSLIGGVIGIISGCLSGFIVNQPKENDAESTPNRGIYQSFQKCVAATLIVLFMVILPINLFSNNFFPSSTILGCISLYVGGLVCLQHLTIRSLLWQTNNAPWDYTHFLNHATERLLMKRAGGGYLFIHDLLRQNLSSKKKQMKPRLKSYSQRIILGIVFVIICLSNILPPTAINSWTVSLKTAQLFSPRLQVNDQVLTDRFFHRIAFHWMAMARLKSGDIISFRPTSKMSYPSWSMTKGLIIGCPGDIINRNQSKLFLNGKSSGDEYLKLKINPTFFDFTPDIVPNNTYLVITHKYNVKTLDIITIIPASHIEERVIFRFWPSFGII